MKPGSNQHFEIKVLDHGSVILRNLAGPTRRMVDVQDAAYLIVACDTFDWDDYPIYVKDVEEGRARKEKLLTGENMQKLMEIYDLNADKAEQLAEHRAMRL